MTSPDLPRQAESHLRAIRSLMERATIYRAISAPTALAAAVLSALAAGLCLYQTRAGSLLDPYYFLWVWLTALGGMVVLNTLFIWSAARARGEAFVSPGLRMAVIALAPPFLTAGVLTFWLAMQPDVLLLATLWCITYGLGLLATVNFAPRSLAVLGWAFLISGLLMPLVFLAEGDLLNRAWWGSVLMGVCFGGYHLLYAAAVYATTQRSEPDAP